MLVRSPVSSRRSATEQIIRQSCNWPEFWEALLKINDTAQQGDAFERLTQLYLQTQPEYQSKLRSVWRWSEVPDEVRSRLGLPATDEGIDILAETHQGDLWAIRCKYHSNPDRAVTRQELGTFVALASVAGLSQRVVAHTSSKPIRKRALMGDTVEIGLDRWLTLDEEAWSLITAALQGRAALPEPRLPRPHQQEALTAARAHYLEQSASRGRLIMPCGTGKSLTAFFIAEALDARNILVAVPSLALIRQSLADWTREYLARGEVPEWLCVCSDDSVGAVDSDSFLAETYDLGIPTTTSLDEISSFLAKPANGRRITFTTYQSSGRLAEAARQAETTFDLAVLDEAHRTVGAASKTFATLLRDDAITIERRLFMTATERVLRGQNDNVLSMDDEGTYGERFFQLTFKEAIAQGIISDYKILTITVSNKRVQEIIRENQLLDLSPDDLGEAEAQAVAAGIALKRVFQEHGISHAISFHRSIRAADRFREQQDRLNDLTMIGPETTNLHISSKKTAGQRAELLRGFVEHKRALMTNARCLTEGVDIPAIDCVLFADPKQSVVDIVQAAGRALRRSEGKEYGYILLPLIVPSGMDLDAFAETTAFRQITKTVTALSTHDERIAEEFRAIENGSRPSECIVEIEGDASVALKLNLDSLAEAIRTRIWERVGRANWRPFTEARTFAQSLGLSSHVEWWLWTTGKLHRAGLPACPPDIPAGPERVYPAEWQSWGDWLGHTRRMGGWRPFDQAREFVRSLRLGSKQNWDHFSRERDGSGTPLKPEDIPANPENVYSEWIGWWDWLGTKHQRGGWRSFDEARLFARSLGLKNGAQYKRWWYGKLDGEPSRPSDIPLHPERVYADAFVNWADWLDANPVQWRSFEDAREFVQQLKLNGQKEWRMWVAGKLPRLQICKPSDIPANPDTVYGQQWRSYTDWLGAPPPKNVRRVWRSYDDAKALVSKLGLKSAEEYFSWCKGELPGLPLRPEDIPASPYEVYKGSWGGMSEFLGIKQQPKYVQMATYEEASTFVRGLGLKTAAEYLRWCRGEIPILPAKPDNIPVGPRVKYVDEWNGWSHYLGVDDVTEADMSSPTLVEPNPLEVEAP
jgi:superfamily II DNA or RNA helicase